MCSLVKVRDRVFVELHVDLSSRDQVLQVVDLMRKLGFDIVALVNRSISEIAQIQEQIDRPLLLSKLYVRGKELRKVTRYLSHYDLLAVKPEDRFILNKLIRVREVDVITVDPTEISTLPTRDQMRVMAKEGKALEILLDKVFTGEYKALKSFDIFFHDVYTIDELVVFFSQNIRKLADVRNPRDVLAFVHVVTEVDLSYLREMRRRWLEFITDVMFRRGVPYRTYY